MAETLINKNQIRGNLNERIYAGSHTEGNCLVLSNVADLSHNWEFTTKILFDGGEYQATLLGWSGNADYTAPSIQTRTGECYIFLSSDNNDWDICSDESLNLNLNYGTKYWLKFGCVRDMNRWLEEDGTMGGANFACSASSAHEEDPAYYAFDGDTTTEERCWWTGEVGQITPQNPAWITYYFPQAIVPTQVKIYNELASPCNIKNAVIQGSNDNSNWTDLYTITNSPDTTGYVNTCNIETNNSYKYFRVYITDGYDAQYGVSIQEIEIFATEEVVGGTATFYFKHKTTENGNYITDWEKRTVKTAYCSVPFSVLGMRQSVYSEEIYRNYSLLYMEETSIVINGQVFFDGKTAVEGTDFTNYGATLI